MAANMSDLPHVIRLHRKSARLNRVELALLAGVGKTVIFDIENGKQSVRWDTLCKVLAALNISVQFDSPILREMTP